MIKDVSILVPFKSLLVIFEIIQKLEYQKWVFTFCSSFRFLFLLFYVLWEGLLRICFIHQFK